MITGIDFVWLPVSSLEKARAFYEGLLGLPVFGEGDGWMEFDLGDGPAIGVSTMREDPAVFEPVTAGPPAIATLHLDALADTIKAAGIAMGDVNDGPVCRSLFFHDPFGNALALHQRKQDPNPDKTIDFVSFPIRDMQAVRAFYEGELGLKPNGEFETDTFLEYGLDDGSTLALGDVTTMGIEHRPVKDGAIGLRTPDLEAVFEKLKARGLARMDELIETPVCQMAFVKDVEGNSLVLHRPKV